MKNKILGTTLLIIGTSVGGGMLALPAVTAASGYFKSSLLLVFAWAVMTVGALLMAEVNLWLHKDNNIISMAKHTLGRKGAIVAWITYLGLLYSLVSAYIAGGSGVVKSLFQTIHINAPSWFNTLLFTFILGSIVWRGIRSVDNVNRAFMSLKLLAYGILVILIAPHIHIAQLPGGHAKHLIGATTVIITSFGFAGSLPTFCSYLEYNPKNIRLAILLGSLITLTCYLIWDAVVQGSISRDTLVAMTQGNTTAELTQSLSSIASSEWIKWGAHLFTSICMFTAFLGVSLGLSDFLADGLKMKKQDNKIFIYSITFVPPLLITLFYPKIFIAALSFAGIFCLTLLALLPALMAYFGRKTQLNAQYQVWGGKKLAIIEALVAALLIIVAVVEKLH